MSVFGAERRREWADMTSTTIVIEHPVCKKAWTKPFIQNVSWKISRLHVLNLLTFEFLVAAKCIWSGSHLVRAHLFYKLLLYFPSFVRKKTWALPCSTSPWSHYVHSRCQMTKEYAAFSKHLLWSVLFHFNSSWLLYWLLSLYLICMPALHQVDYNHLFALAVFFEGPRHLSLWWIKKKKNADCVLAVHKFVFLFIKYIVSWQIFPFLQREKNHNYCTATGKMQKTLSNFVILYSGNVGCWEYRSTQVFLVFLFQTSNRENCFIRSKVMCLPFTGRQLEIPNLRI